MLSSISGRQLETVLTVCLKLCNKLLNYGTVFWPHKCFGAIQLTQTYTCLVVIILYLKMIYHVVVVPGNDFEIANYYPWDNLFFFCKLLFQVVILFCCKLMFLTTVLHVTVNSFFFANCCSRQPFSDYFFQTNVYKFLNFFANVTNCYSCKIF